MVATATQVGKGNDLSLKLDYATKEAGAYPIVLVTYEIVCSKAKDPAKVELLKAFLKHFSSVDTQKSLEGIGLRPAAGRGPGQGRDRDRRPLLTPDRGAPPGAPRSTPS